VQKIPKIDYLIVRVVVSKSVVCHFIVDSMPTFYKIESTELNLTDQLNCLFKTIPMLFKKASFQLQKNLAQ